MLNVVLVDDEPLVLEGLKSMIPWEKYGFQVCGEALNGVEAFKLIQSKEPDLVITDINMPSLTGLELIEQSNRQLSRPPKFIVLSGYDDFNYARTAMRQRVVEYLLKPIDEEEFDILLSKLSQRIMNEIEAEQGLVKKQQLAINNIMNRLLQGEYDYNQRLHDHVVQSLELDDDALLQCIILETKIPYEQLVPIIQRIFSPYVIHTFMDRLGRKVFLLRIESGTDELISAEACALYEELVSYGGEPVIVALSDMMTGVRSIRELYLQAEELIRSQCCYQGKKGVIKSQTARSLQSRQDSYREKFDELFQLVETGAIGELDCFIRNLFGLFSGNTYEFKSVKANVAHLELMLCRLITELMGDPVVLMKELQATCGILEHLLDYVTLEQYVRNLCTRVTDNVLELRQKNEGNTIYHVIQYVDREFRSKLQLQELARQFHMNATYLGQLFKKNTGKSFNVYLNERRIEEAKKLLKRTTLKISDVALQVGYPNTDYFINKFKNHTGVLPSVYKQQLEDEQQ